MPRLLRAALDDVTTDAPLRLTLRGDFTADVRVEGATAERTSEGLVLELPAGRHELRVTPAG